MSGRELVILLLGLAIVAVVLRGLYVALNARRGQIKLAIDKNIPQNVDLESLEMAELPGGGARVVTRSLEEVNRQNSALDKAEFKARAIKLADDEDENHIPVLMDAVELSQPSELQAEPIAAQYQEPSQEDELEGFAAEEQAFDTRDMALAEETPAESGEVPEEEFASHVGQMPSIGDGWEDDDEAMEAPAQDSGERHAETSDEEDPDAVLFDYDEEEEEVEEVESRDRVDSMSSVTPDYDDADEDEAIEHIEEAFAGEPDDESYDENDFDDTQGEKERNEYAESIEQSEMDEAPKAFAADSDMAEFSMTAGERIGGSPSAKGVVKQSSLFDEDEDYAEDVVSKTKRSRSLFSMFGRKPAEQNERVGQKDQVAAAPTVDDYELDEPRQVEHDDETAPAASEQEIAYEDEIIDELDQKRAATVEYEIEAPQVQSEEFEHSEVLVLNVTAKNGRVFSGDDLLHILIMSGLKFGDMNIFHKRLVKDNQGSVIFSVANMLNPGTFDLNNMDEFTTLGISFFLALPTPINNLDAFEQMLGIAQDVRDTLDGDLKDDHRNGMTAQTIEHYRQRIRDFELRRLKAVAARG